MQYYAIIRRLVVGVGGWWMVDGWVQVAFFDDLSSRSLM
jgi:hypothetical protein